MKSNYLFISESFDFRYETIQNVDMTTYRDSNISHLEIKPSIKNSFFHKRHHTFLLKNKYFCGGN